MCRFNTCRDLYERILAKGKSKKLALIAVCNKLLKQAFAIAESRLLYDKKYKSILVKINESPLVFQRSKLITNVIFKLF
jgi:hypothetical protein